LGSIIILAVIRNEIGLVVLDVEAKVDEPFGPTLGEKKADTSNGQLERIAYLEHELGCTSSFKDGIRYQLLHRTVSALLTARVFHACIAVMLVHSFCPKAKWREDFDAFAETVAGRPVTKDLYEIELGDTPRLIIGWCRGNERYLAVELPRLLRKYGLDRSAFLAHGK